MFSHVPCIPRHAILRDLQGSGLPSSPHNQSPQDKNPGLENNVFSYPARSRTALERDGAQNKWVGQAVSDSMGSVIGSFLRTENS